MMKNSYKTEFLILFICFHIPAIVCSQQEIYRPTEAGKVNHQTESRILSESKTIQPTKNSYNGCLTLNQRICGLTRLWAAVKHRYALMEYAQVSWDELLPQYLEVIQKVKSDEEYYLILERMLALLKDNHTHVTYIPGRNNLHKPNVKIEKIGDNHIVTDYFQYHANKDSNLRIGDMIINVNGHAIEKLIEDIKPYVSASSEIETVDKSIDRILWKDKGESVLFNIERNGRIIDINEPVVVHHQRIYQPNNSSVSYNVLKNNIGYIKIPTFSLRQVVSQFSKALEEFQTMKCKAMILDVRDNRGGNDNYGIQIAERLIDQPIYFYRTVGFDRAKEVLKLQPEDLQKLTMYARPSGSWQYKGEIIVLVNRRTESAAEDFVMGLQDSGRAYVIGEQTLGATGNPFMIRLPGGAKARICINKIIRLDGSRFHNVGIKPDWVVNRTLGGVQNQKDEILDAAMKHLLLIN